MSKSWNLIISPTYEGIGIYLDSYKLVYWEAIVMVPIKQIFLLTSHKWDGVNKTVT
jgi:hypothetical protein